MTAPLYRSRRDWLITAAAAGAGSFAGGCAYVAPAAPRAAQPFSAQPPSATTDASLALHVLNRFAYGPRPGDIEAVMRMGADTWLEHQLEPERLTQSATLQAALSERTVLTQPHAPTLARFAKLQGDALSSRLTQEERDAARRQLTTLLQQVQGDARDARVLRAVYSTRQLEEVLVEFWFNHFNVFAGKESVRATAGFFEAEAIRPHVLGRFRDLLGATARHPAMLNYLDNASSVRAGFRIPSSIALPDGFLPPQGLNENYARELLELHTLGVDGGYTQGDVTELARIFTGWSFDRRNPGATDAFRFYPARHDDGPKRLMGLDVPGGGQRQGEWALDVLARHPSTARHVARKLAGAFVADVPPASLIERLSATFLATDGNLREVMRTLARSPEFLDPDVRAGKFKTPYRYVVSTARACDLPVSSPRALVGTIARMGMPIYLCPTPDGWRDVREAWLSPELLRQRVVFSAGLAAPPTLPDPVVAHLSPEARAVVNELPPRERLAIALASPDFMRR